ncbi:MAG: hypothetical protein ACOY6K_22375 [Pseudomonadota bacterium]
MAKSTTAKLAEQLKWLHNLADVSREAHFEKLARTYGEGFAAAVRKEFEKQQQENKDGRR